MAKPRKSQDEKELEKLAKKLLSTPPKPREKVATESRCEEAATMGYGPSRQPPPSEWNQTASANSAALDRLTN